MAALQAPDNPEILNSIAWLLYENKLDLAKAKRLAVRAVELAPNEANYLHTLASIELTLGDWPRAKETVRTWIHTASEEFISDYRNDVIGLFKAVASLGKASDLVSMVNQQEVASHWKPWVEAIAFIGRQDRDPNGKPSVEAQKILILLQAETAQHPEGTVK
jgi:tetratricopeptide (TPR) repeat protein